jgi:hypothetical protein
MIEYDIQQAVNEAYFANDHREIMQNVSNDNTKLLEVEVEDNVNNDDNNKNIRKDPTYGI